ncbi:hypothetical protein, partial [Chromohalobacter israelensis]|uniref:hypothetical protein n=1 Tax=Chromohalobacter israelensis TaxID=141390 RepID=UPI001027DCD9
MDQPTVPTSTQRTSEEHHQERAYELFGEVMFGGSAEPRGSQPGVNTEEYDFDNPTRGQEVARQSVPLVRQTDEERQQQQEEAEADAPGLVEGIDLATQQEWIPRLMGVSPEFTPDPDYEMSVDSLQERAKDLPEDALDYISKAKSQAEADYLEQRYRADYEREQELSKMGWTGVGLRVGAALTDPAAWGIGAAASTMFGPAGLVGAAGKNLNRARRIIQAGAAGAAGNLAVESAIAANKPVYDNMNLLYASGLGFALGGGMAAISRNPSTQAEADGLANAGRGLQRAAEERVGDMIRDAQFSPAQAQGDAGAAMVSREVPIRDDDLSIYSFLTAVNKNPSIAPKAAFSKTRFSSMAVGLSSENPATRAIFKPLAEEGVGYTDRNAAVSIGASERQRLREQRVMTEWMRGYQPNFREWKKGQSQNGKWKPFQDEEMAKVFNEQVTDYVEGLLEDPHPAVARQGNVMRKILDDYREDLNQPMAYRQEFGRPVKGFGTLEENANYVPHEFDLQRVRQLVKEFGTPNVEQLIARSIQTAAEDITEEAAQKAGRAYLKTIRSMDAGMGMDTARILSSGDGEEIKAFLKNNADRKDISEADIEDIVDSLTVRKSEGGQKYGKSRTPMDIGFKMNLRRNPEYGSGEREVSVRELFNRDSHDLLARYNRRMSGALAMARYRIPGLSEPYRDSRRLQTLRGWSHEHFQ